VAELPAVASSTTSETASSPNHSHGVVAYRDVTLGFHGLPLADFGLACPKRQSAFSDIWNEIMRLNDVRNILQIGSPCELYPVQVRDLTTPKYPSEYVSWAWPRQSPNVARSFPQTSSFEHDSIYVRRKAQNSPTAAGVFRFLGQRLSGRCMRDVLQSEL
jgi:hypothetical protein